ncbi:extracellular solute-binding protein [Candidatus Peregrinibacteria bacterium]|nr:extracellular solute-binding protein [Candidatus Peregrinibacteria bacterium]
MKKFITLFLALGALSSSVFLSACTKKCPLAKDNIPGTSTFRSDCATDDVGASGKKELNFYFVYDNTDAFQEQIQAFQSQYPDIKINTKKFVDLKEYEDEIVNEIAEGNGPDVMMMQNSWLSKHSKKLLPMPLDLPIAMNADIFRQTFFQAAQDDLIIDNQVYGMPMSIDNLAVYYNKALLKDLLVNDDRPAELWEKIKDQVFTLTKRNNSPERFSLAGIAMGRSDNISSAVDILYALMIQEGVQWYDAASTMATFGGQTGTSRATGTYPGAEALKLFTSFALPAYKNYSWNDTITGRAPADKEVNPFITGKVAMIIGYPYLYDILVQKIQDQQRVGGVHVDVKDIDVAPMPQLVQPDQTGKRDTLASYFPLVVSRNTKHPKEAWQFVQFMTTADSLQTYYKKTHRPTSRKDMVDEQRTQPLFGVFATQSSYAKSFPIYDARAYDSIFSVAIDQVVRNVLMPSEAIREAQDRVSCVIKRQKGLIDPSQNCLNFQG